APTPGHRPGSGWAFCALRVRVRGAGLVPGTSISPWRVPSKARFLVPGPTCSPFRLSGFPETVDERGGDEVPRSFVLRSGAGGRRSRRSERAAGIGDRGLQRALNPPPDDSIGGERSAV